MDKLKNKETLRSFQEIMAKSLRRKGIKDEEQVQEAWKVIKTSTTEFSKKVTHFTQRKKTKK